MNDVAVAISRRTKRNLTSSKKQEIIVSSSVSSDAILHIEIDDVGQQKK